MKVRGWLYVGTVVATLLTPLAAVAQAIGSLTTAPLSAAPAVGMPQLVGIALALGVGAMSVLRRKAARATIKLAVVGAAIMLAGIAYAVVPLPSVPVSGNQCGMQTTQTWASAVPTTLDNQCPNALLIVAIDACGERDTASAEFNTLPTCVVGQTLAAGTACDLPMCV